MKKREIQEPIQQRSIDKKNLILDVGLDLIKKKGYYHTNTAEIAKAAGVSSGIIYRYFIDKKDIFIQALKRNVTPNFEQLHLHLSTVQSIEDIKQVLPEVIKNFIEFHTFDAKGYVETAAMILLDEDIKSYMDEVEGQVMLGLEETFLRVGVSPANIKEKVYLIYQMANHLCDDYISVDHTKINYDYIIQQTINLIIVIIEKDN